MIEDATVVRRNPTVEYRSLGDDGGGVLLHVGTGAYHGLNEVGAAVWALLEPEQGATFGSIVEGVRAQVDDAPENLAEEIGEFLEDLSTRDLVSLGEGQE
jgi:hypothetical protein